MIWLYRTVGFLLVLCLLLKFSNFLLYNDNSYTRVMFHEMYSSESMDVVFIGSSAVYRHFDPEVWDKQLGVCTFNLGTSSQTPDDAYYIMRELLKKQSPKYCIYGINFIALQDLEGYENPTKDYIIFDYFRPSVNRWLFGKNVFHNKSVLNAWIPATRNQNKSLIETAKQVVNIKKTDNYRRYGYDVYSESDIEEYRGRGFVYTYLETEIGAVGKVDGYVFCENKISDRYISYMRKIKKLCDENDCELIFVVPPLPYASIAQQGDYQEVLDFYKRIASEIGVNVFNFDVSKPECLILDDNDFYDSAHMSGKGAEKFSDAAAGIIKKYMDGEEIEWNRYFYSSYEELMDNSPWIFNTWIEKTESGYTAQSTYGNGVIPEYCFQCSEDGGKTWHMLQNYSVDDRIDDSSIPNGCNMLMVWAKPEGSMTGGTDYQQCDRMVLE